VGQERKITYWDIRKPQPETLLESSPFKGESDELISIAISHNNRYFATGGALGVVRIYDYTTGAFVTECRAHSNMITCIRFSPDDKQIVSTGRDGLVVVWNFFL
jgi:WD40 repeat protein